MLVKEINVPAFWSLGCNFNPSIVPIAPNLYLLSFRNFRRYPVSTTDKSLNHPWLGGPSSQTWWELEQGGYDGTGFIILHIDDDNNVTVEQVLDFELLGAVDLRLSYVNSKIVATYNSLVDPESVGRRIPGRLGLFVDIGNQRIEYGLPPFQMGCCTLILGMELNVSVENNRYILSQASEEQIICQNVSEGFEKNWSLWYYNHNLFISYHLIPKHTVFIPRESFNQCNVRFEKGHNIFHEYKFITDMGSRFHYPRPLFRLEIIDI